MLNIKTDIHGLKELQDHIDFVEKLRSMQTDVNFQKFIQNKVLETVNRIARERIANTTNDEYIEEYILRNSIREEEGLNGFILYNNLTIPAELTSRNTKNQDRNKGLVRNYDNGFNLALAFEYGVGIVGQNNPINGAWAYNINNYGEEGWYYKTPSGESVRTQGYQGAEVYRFTAIECKEKMKDWVWEYYRKEVK